MKMMLSLSRREKDVVRALAAVGLFDHHGHQLVGELQSGYRIEEIC
jgi:hypothetical protein